TLSPLSLPAPLLSLPAPLPICTFPQARHPPIFSMANGLPDGLCPSMPLLPGTLVDETNEPRTSRPLRSARVPGRSGMDGQRPSRSEEHTSELQSLTNTVCRLLP